MKQRVFPFEIPDRILLDILSKINDLHRAASTLQNWFYSVMHLLDTHANVHFGDLVTMSSSRNGHSPSLTVVSYHKGNVACHAAFPNPFLEEAFKHCFDKTPPGLTEIHEEACLRKAELPYCPVVVSLGYNEHRFGLFAAGSYHDRAIVMRNRRLFKILGTEMSFYLFVRHMQQMVSSFLFEKGESAMSFEDLLSFKFKQLIEKIDLEVGGNILGDVIMLVEKILIRLALEKTNHKLGHAAALLGINRNTLRKKIHTLGLESKEA